ncbi:outer membrane homotrimeric porin [Solidesulfovibrio sp.]|uniref:outer membrane homotrimeric porin n=1 Tax=Solidesulfovibrio sp. TaxID=2910990 RepID=UPI0026306D6F|nr:outer membrane homotrimeric porin [Solidesulfovibrio sp.]
MKRLNSLVLAGLIVLCAFASAFAATEVKMTGDARIYGNFFENRNYTGWNKIGTKTEENFEIWERFRLRTDFIANEAVKFRLGIKVEDTWGHGTFTAANPDVAVQVDLAYLQFMVPGCEGIQVTAGLQDVNLPQSSLFYQSPVWSDKMAALTISAPLIDKTLSVMTGFGRLIDSNRTYDTSTTQKSDELDAYFLALPVTIEGFKATPWAMVAVAGRNADYTFKDTTDVAEWGNNFANTLVSAASSSNMATPGTMGYWKNNQNAYIWAGGAFEVTALDPIKFYGDVIYGGGATNDHKAAKREGWMVDFGVEYTGLDIVTPQVFAFWSSGEDKSTLNGSERMPYMRSYWGPGNSFLFDNSQELGKGSNMYTNPVGNYGFGASLNNISFIEKLTHRLTFVYVHGNNSNRAIRYARTWLNNSYFTMGHDLGENDYVMGFNFDTKYMIYENLAAVLETGWAHGDFQQSVWGHRLTHQADKNDNNSWKVAFGLTYKF